MIIGDYRFNPDALLARMLYRWHWRIALLLALLVSFVGVLGGAIPPFWRSAAGLIIQADPAALLLVDGRPWPFPLYAGAHRVEALLPDNRQVSTELALQPGVTTTLRLPPGLKLREQRILPAAPGLQISRIERADRAWRIVSTPPPGEDEGAATQPLASHTLAFAADTTARLTMLDAYAGLADLLHLDGQMLSARYRADTDAIGAIDVQGWSHTTVSIPISGTVVLLRFVPDGGAVLVGESITADGVRLSLLQPDQAPTDITALPGAVVRLDWHPDGRAVVVHSRSADRHTLTLVRLKPDLAAATIADLPDSRYAGALTPLTFTPDGVYWVAPDADGTEYLWRTRFAALTPERLHPLDAAAIRLLPDGTLQVAVIRNDQVLLGRYADTGLIVEATLEQVSATPDLAGIWADGELLLCAGPQIWLITATEGD